MAVREGQKHTVECLIEEEADTNIKDNDGVSHASYYYAGINLVLLFEFHSSALKGPCMYSLLVNVYC